MCTSAHDVDLKKTIEKPIFAAVVVLLCLTKIRSTNYNFSATHTLCSIAACAEYVESCKCESPIEEQKLVTEAISQVSRSEAVDAIAH